MKKLKKHQLRINIKEVPSELKLNDDAVTKMNMRQFVRVTFDLHHANNLIQRGKITEPGTYQIKYGWSWKKPLKYSYYAKNIK